MNVHFLLQADWTAAHASDARLVVIGRGAQALVVLLLLLLVFRALVVGRRYRARGVLSESDLEALHAELRGAESRTTGEIVPVVVEWADEHPQAPWRAAALTLVAGTGLFAADLPWDAPILVMSSQLGFGMLGYLLATFLPDFRRWFVTEHRATEMAEEQATIEFQRLGLVQTAERTGVLLFVALFERRVVVLADEGIAKQVGPEMWTTVNKLVLKDVRRAALKDGIVAGIHEVGRVLAKHFPSKDGGTDEIPDRIVVRGM